MDRFVVTQQRKMLFHFLYWCLGKGFIIDKIPDRGLRFIGLLNREADGPFQFSNTLVFSWVDSYYRYTQFRSRVAGSILIPFAGPGPS
jgi:hypothetical protein